MTEITLDELVEYARVSFHDGRCEDLSKLPQEKQDAWRRCINTVITRSLDLPEAVFREVAGLGPEQLVFGPKPDDGTSGEMIA